MTDHAALLSEGRQRFEAGAFNEALACLLPVLQSDPGNLDALYLVALTRLRQGFVGDGIALLERISAARPDFIDALGHLASAYRAVGRPRDAADWPVTH